MSLNAFHARIRAAIADKNLQAALDKNAEQRRVARSAAYDSLAEDPQVLRQRAHAIRAETIANHVHYLETFRTNARANGYIVHEASDAAQARQIVLEIARQHGAKLFAKSKTMVSEEVEINHALEAAGIRVVETDLGEYIVQLRQEPPSHIITPAVHLRREDVGETFHEKLNIPLTSDIPTMTDAARAALRETFLQADIGLSGVNFGVAEGGAITLVTNEGNGRMVTTLPAVHIALMGIERLVPTYEDLALMLTMLPRASTGQKISVYTQIIHGPRREYEIDGAVERHIVLVDNGRSGVRGTPLNDTLFCIRCGACLNACPIFREVGGYSYASIQGDYNPYPGPIGSALTPGLFDQERFGHLAQASTLCGACKDACPVDIDLPTMLLRARAGGKQLNQTTLKPHSPQGIPWPVRWGLRMYAWFAARPRRFAFAQKGLALISRIWSPQRTWMGLPAFTGWGYSKDFPRPAARTFRDRWVDRHQKAVIGDRKPEAGGQSDLGRDQISMDGGGVSERSRQQTLVEGFQEELEVLGGKFVRCTAGDLAARILELLKTWDLMTVMAWEDPHLPSGLLDELRGAGVRIHSQPDPEIKVGITGALAGIAQTGTLVVTSGNGKPQSTSLLPEKHIAIMREEDLFENLAEVLSLRQVQTAAAVSLISGPSKTADIEMTLTIGVHGPGAVIVFCI